MIEVFKTNVKQTGQAEMLLKQIHLHFKGYTANFDLEDCDKILRVQSRTENVQVLLLIHLLEKEGFKAEVLYDDLQPANDLQ